MTVSDGLPGEERHLSTESIVARCSHLEGFVWMLWRAGVLRIEDGKALVNGVDIPDEWSELLPVVVEEFQQTAREYQVEQARIRGAVTGRGDRE